MDSRIESIATYHPLVAEMLTELEEKLNELRGDLECDPLIQRVCAVEERLDKGEGPWTVHLALTDSKVLELTERLDKLQKKYDKRILTQTKYFQRLGEELSPKIEELTTVMCNLYSFLSRDPRVPQ